MAINNLLERLKAEGLWNDPPYDPELEQLRLDTIEVQLKELAAINSKKLPELLAKFSVQTRLTGLKPEERLEGLSPEERLEGLSPEERLEGLSPEERKQLLNLLSQEQNETE